MKPDRLLAFVLLFLLVTGCSTTRSTATGPDASRPPAERVSAPAEETASGSAEAAPEDWYQRDLTDDRLFGISAEKAYQTLLKGKEPVRTVVVAVIDGGVDINHEDLQGQLWINEDETPGNGVDDDNNGYKDDIHGWNFIGGADGENVKYDTLELTREVARLRAKYENADPASLSREERLEYDYYQKLRAEHEARVQEMSQYAAGIGGAYEAFRQANNIMAGVLGTTDFTLDQVAAVQSDDQQIQQAQRILIGMAGMGLNEKTLQEQKEYVDNRLAYGLNLDFDPRPTVGDDYGDLTEQGYGNADVKGPDAFHGTHVAGIIAAARNNQIGMDGIAPAVRIMALRAVPNGDERDKDVANAIRYAADNGAQLINMSFGKAYSPEKELVDEAVRYAQEKGVLLIHGAGNDAQNIDSTASYPTRYYLTGGEKAENWIEVGASSWERGDALAANFSNYGKNNVDLFAPGVSIYSTMPGNRYDRLDGTSMAAPVVTGAAALLMAYYPELTASQVRDILLRSAVPYTEAKVQQPGAEGSLIDFGQLSATGGIVNVYNAVKMAEEMQ